ncbi:pyrimidine dimer DNA glycosylase [Xylanimonas oleitrophica]|uniref:Pyrimidine dimer DNA glycosylase n=1 Tax=Xylanimonas oleitrophica TaxID=2607479 RepID=A0A2W5WML2_9MICO|nr:pyrimidine dimer DNA glycosylase/endonuclease V [Xylanimonas oleitrophica]PZR52242.1 pyrimidine dimer DNA glycosylase [Xylanimonas oleitrophica]
MRLWSLDPAYLDRQGLTACWREALLAQAVLAERTRGYRHHPQLERFREQPDPLASVGAYLAGVADEAGRRGYRFDRSRIGRPPGGWGQTGAPGDPSRDPTGTQAREVTGHAPGVPRIPVTDGQLDLEWRVLTDRMRRRSPGHAARVVAETQQPRPHPLFTVVPGPVASWERAVAPGPASSPPAVGRQRPEPEPRQR